MVPIFIQVGKGLMDARQSARGFATSELPCTKTFRWNLSGHPF